jgi:hypothetical protein
MNDPDAYPELILQSAQEQIRALARKQARDDARREARAARRRAHAGRRSWWRVLLTRSAEPHA